jgi:polyphosphate kinase 2 (PPK2 family)
MRRVWRRGDRRLAARAQRARLGRPTQDYLRSHQERLPARGEIGIFNRSHYEEVLVVRVHPENLVAQKLPPDAREHHVCKHRYHAITGGSAT